MNEGAVVGENTTKKSFHHVVSDMVLHRICEVKKTKDDFCPERPSLYVRANERSMREGARGQEGWRCVGSDR